MIPFSRQMWAGAFSRHCFAHFVYVVPFSKLLIFFDFFPALSVFFLSKTKSDIVYARAQAAMLRSSGHFNETEQGANKWSIRESFEGKPRSERPSVLTNCARKSIENTSVERKAKQSLRFAKEYTRG